MHVRRASIPGRTGGGLAGRLANYTVADGGGPTLTNRWKIVGVRHAKAKRVKQVKQNKREQTHSGADDATNGHGVPERRGCW